MNPNPSIMNKKLAHIFFWGIISAAFIGPGTITTAASAGAGYRYQLLWALVFSIIACIVLQEGSARLRLATGDNLAEVLKSYFKDKRGGFSLTLLVAGSIIFGCAAYETGNILGAVAGGMLIADLQPVTYTVALGLAAGGLLWFGSIRLIAQLMGFVVAAMGLCFLAVALTLKPPVGAIIGGTLVPSFPEGGEVMILGLIGTTVVPYNLFLGSGLAHRQSLREMRLSLSAAIIMGGVVSAAVLVVGASISGAFSFEKLAVALERQLGGWAHHLLGIGLLAAGFSSALTAPLAAAITAKSLGSDSGAWNEKGRGYRAVWGGVLLAGVLFGVLEVQPVPAIILAQALNGIILPVVAIFIMLMVNNRSLVGEKYINGPWYNTLMGAVVFVTILLGVRNLLNALLGIAGVDGISRQALLGLGVALSLLCSWPLYSRIRRLRRIEEG